MNTKEVIARMQSIIDCFEVCRVHKKDIYVPLDVEDVEALRMAVELLKQAPLEVKL